MRHRVNGERLTDEVTRAIQQGRRERNAAAGECVNQNNRGTHEKPLPGEIRCPHCKAVHKYGAEAVRERRIPVSDALYARLVQGGAESMSERLDEAINAAIDAEERVL